MSVNPRGESWEVYVKRGPHRYRLNAKTEAQGKTMEKDILTAITAGRAPDLQAIREISESGKKTLRQAIDATYRDRWKGERAGEAGKLNADLVARILGEGRAISDLDDDDMDTLRTTLEDQGNSIATINRKMSALRCVFKFAEDRKWVTNPPKLKHKKELNGRIRWLSDEEEKLLLAKTIHIGRQDMADLWVFLIDTGCRVGEALSLEEKDVTDTHVTFWRTKNYKPRTVPLTARLQALLRGRKGNPFPMTYPEARNTWDRVRGLLGKEEDSQWIMHMLRHTCASRLAQRGCSLLVLMEWLGHKSVTMTLRYAHLAPSSLDGAVALLNGPVSSGNSQRKAA